MSPVLQAFCDELDKIAQAPQYPDPYYAQQESLPAATPSRWKRMGQMALLGGLGAGTGALLASGGVQLAKRVFKPETALKIMPALKYGLPALGLLGALGLNQAMTRQYQEAE